MDHNKKISIGNDRIDNISSILYGEQIHVYAVIGDNGVGKSTFLDLIHEWLFCPSEFKNHARCTIVYEDGGEIYQWSNLDKHSKEQSYFIKDKTKVIYFSDLIDNKYIFNHYKYWLYEEIEGNLGDGTEDDESKEHPSVTSQLEGRKYHNNIDFKPHSIYDRSISYVLELSNQMNIVIEGKEFYPIHREKYLIGSNLNNQRRG